MYRQHISPVGLMSALLLCALSVAADGQESSPTAPAQSPQQPVVLDRVIGVINGDVLLESDVDSEMRFAALRPYSDPSRENTRQTATERLVNRTLILQQMNDPKQQLKLPPPSEDEVQARLNELRKAIPACKFYKCETEEGWHEFLKAHGFTEEQVVQRWRQRLAILQFTEARFRAGIRVSHADIQAYYDKDLLPQFAKQKVTPPPLDSIATRIEEILVEQKVNDMLLDWVKSLRDQGSVLILDPSYGQSNPAESDQSGGSS